MTPMWLAFAKGRISCFNCAAEHGIWRLKAGYWRDLLRALHLFNVEIGHADVADLALLFKFRERRPALFDLFFGIGPVDLVEVDGVAAEAAERGCAAPLREIWP